MDFSFFNSILHTFLPKGREAFRLPKVPNMVGLRRLGYNVCNNPKIKKGKTEQCRKWNESEQWQRQTWKFFKVIHSKFYKYWLYTLPHIVLGTFRYFKSYFNFKAKIYIFLTSLLCNFVVQTLHSFFALKTWKKIPSKSS